MTARRHVSSRAAALADRTDLSAGDFRTAILLICCQCSLVEMSVDLVQSVQAPLNTSTLSTWS